MTVSRQRNQSLISLEKKIRCVVSFFVFFQAILFWFRFLLTVNKYCQSLEKQKRKRKQCMATSWQQVSRINVAFWQEKKLFHFFTKETTTETSKSSFSFIPVYTFDFEKESSEKKGSRRDKMIILYIEIDPNRNTAY